LVGGKMKFYDQHMHSHLSFDSFEDPYNYISEDTENLVFTEHLDLENNANDGKDDIPDFDQLFKWKKEMAEETGVELLPAVEIGYVPHQKDRLVDLVNQYDFDIKLLSCHQNQDYDYMDEVDEKTETMVNRYLNQLIEALKDMPDSQIMAHFDYGFRIHDISAADLGPYEDKLLKIFELCIENNMAFELNSKSLFRYGKYDLYEWAIPKYQELGGKLFSLGSDAHSAEEHKMNFTEATDLLKRFNVDQVVVYKNQSPHYIPLEEIK